jgi:hypothetical protein
MTRPVGTAKRLWCICRQIKDHYVRTVSELSQQTVQLQEELKRTKNDLKVSNIQVVDLRKALEELGDEMKGKVRGQLISICMALETLQLNLRFLAALVWLAVSLERSEKFILFQQPFHFQNFDLMPYVVYVNWILLVA